MTSFFAVPTMLDAMSRDPGFRSRDLSALRTIGAAGAPLPLPTLRTWLDRGITMQQSYGMTEAAPGCTVLDSADAERKVGSAGKPVFFTDVRVVRPDGSEAGVDEVGEVIVQGPNVMAGYWNEPERTAEVLADGWYRTGDAGSLDDEGFLYIRRPLQGHDHLGRGEHLPRRGRVRAARVPRGGGGRRHRRPRPAVGRGGHGGGRARRRAPTPTPRSCGSGCAVGSQRSRCPSTWSSPTSSPRPRPARSGSPTCATTTSRRRRPPHEHHHDDRRTALAQGPGARAPASGSRSPRTG